MRPPLDVFFSVSENQWYVLMTTGLYITPVLSDEAQYVLKLDISLGRPAPEDLKTNFPYIYTKISHMINYNEKYFA